MTIKLTGATRATAYRFSGDEIATLAESPQLVRWGGLTEEHVAWLATDIAARGQQTPVLVRRSDDGKPELVAGRHRRAAILRVNADPAAYGLEPDASIDLLAHYRELSDDVAVIKSSFAENTGRPLTCMDLAQGAYQLSELGWPNKVIAETLSTSHKRITPSRVSQLKDLMQLPERVQMALHQGRLPESAARAMLRLQLNATTMEMMATQLEEGEIKAGDITALANDARRQAGKMIRRTLYELKTKLDEMGTAKAMDLLAWMDGELKSDKRVEEIFAEED